ncbi:24376_t:CDS:2, partial [Dentiscutata erythropus]
LDDMFGLDEGEDIVKVVKGLARISLAQITINHNDEDSRSNKKNSNQKKPIALVYTKPTSDWTILIPTMQALVALVPTSNRIVKDIDIKGVNFNNVDDYHEMDIV